MKLSTDVEQVAKHMERFDVSKMSYLERLKYKRYTHRVLRFAYLHDLDELADNCWETAMEVIWRLGNETEDINLRTYLFHRLEILIGVIETYSNISMHDLFDDNTIDFITDIQMEMRDVD